MNAVKDRLKITLGEMRNFLRIAPELKLVLNHTSLQSNILPIPNAGDIIHVGMILLIGDVSYRVTRVDDIANTATLDKTLPSKVGVVTSHPDDSDILGLIEAAKEEADAYMANPFAKDGINEPIPYAVKLWCMRYVSRWYANRENGVVAESVTGAGSATYTLDRMDNMLALKAFRLIHL